MPIVAQDVITQAYALSVRNRAGAIANETVEMLSVLNRLQLDAFNVAARLNPAMIGQTQEVAYSGTPIFGWPRPGTALAVYRIEATATTNPALGDKTKIVVVPDDDLIAETFHPTVFERGGVFYGGTSTGSPTSGALRFFFARRPALMTVGGSLSQELDSLIPDAHTGLFVYGLGLHLASKDQRADEAGWLQQEMGAWQTAWVEYLQGATAPLVTRFAPRPSMTPALRVITPPEE